MSDRVENDILIASSSLTNCLLSPDTLFVEHSEMVPNVHPKDVQEVIPDGPGHFPVRTLPLQFSVCVQTPYA